MTRRISGTRSAALRRAQEAKARRDAERIQRERRLESALADFYEHTEAAALLRSEAQRRAERLLAAAETAAAIPEEAARRAVAVLRELGESQPQIAELTGMSVAEVRACLATQEAAAHSPPLTA